MTLLQPLLQRNDGNYCQSWRQNDQNKSEYMGITAENKTSFSLLGNAFLIHQRLEKTRRTLITDTLYKQQCNGTIIMNSSESNSSSTMS